MTFPLQSANKKVPGLVFHGYGFFVQTYHSHEGLFFIYRSLPELLDFGLQEEHLSGKQQV